MTLDLPTLLTVAAILTASSMAITLLTWLQHREQVALPWMAAVPALAMLGALTRATLPTLPAVLVGNVAVLLAGSSFWAACRVLRDAGLGPLPFLVPPAIWVAACSVPAVQGDLNARVALISVMSAAQVGTAILELRADRRGRLPAQRALMGVTGLHGGLLLARAVAATLAWNDTTTPASSFGLVTLGSLVSVTLLCAAMVALAKDRAGQVLRVEAGTDHLTGLANRRQFERDMDEAVRRSAARGERVALLMIDVDAFKAFNDLYGHAVGDVCLREVARALRATLRQRGASAYRFGGEEFAALLPGAGPREAMTVAEDLRRAVAVLAIPHASGARGIVTISLGCASAVANGADDAARLFDTADRALYRAKEGGRDQACLGGGPGSVATGDRAGPGPGRGQSVHFQSLG